MGHTLGQLARTGRAARRGPARARTALATRPAALLGRPSGPMAMALASVPAVAIGRERDGRSLLSFGSGGARFLDPVDPFPWMAALIVFSAMFMGKSPGGPRKANGQFIKDPWGLLGDSPRAKTVALQAGSIMEAARVPTIFYPVAMLMYTLTNAKTNVLLLPALNWATRRLTEWTGDRLAAQKAAA